MLKRKVGLHVHTLTWPNPKKMRGEKNGVKNWVILKSGPPTGKQKGGALYCHTPEKQTGRSTVMKTDERCNAFSTEGNEIRCWQCDGHIPGLAFKRFLTSITWSVNASSAHRNVFSLAHLHFLISIICIVCPTFSRVCALQQVAWDKHFTSNTVCEDLKSPVSAAMP